MVITGDIRSDGGQLAKYLVTYKDNEDIQILEVDGRDYADELYLQETILGMALNAELTKSNKAFLHVQLSPAIGEDQAMTTDDWQLAADILAQQTGYEDQRRVIVLHTKKGRTHAHVVYERYNHATGKMIDNKHSRLKMDNARPMIEKALGHSPTPRRNPQRPELKIASTQLWNNTNTGMEFIKAARKAGYIIAEGTGKRPFMIVDENGRAFDLVRQIDGVKTKEVRARLRNEKLITDKQAIEEMRELQSENSGKREKQRIENQPAFKVKAKGFADNRDMLAQNTEEQKTAKPKATEFSQQVKQAVKATEPPKANDDQLRKEKIAQAFAENRNVVKGKDGEDKRQKIIAEQDRLKQRKKQRKPRR